MTRPTLTHTAQALLNTPCLHFKCHLPTNRTSLSYEAAEVYLALLLVYDDNEDSLTVTARSTARELDTEILTLAFTCGDYTGVAQIWIETIGGQRYIYGEH